MKALSIRQPWAWLIVRPDLTDPAEREAAFAAGTIKDIENRTWHTKFRGRFLVHASSGMTRQEYLDASEFARSCGVTTMPAFAELQRGGIIGSVELVDSADSSYSQWYMGEKAFVLRDAVPLPFAPLKGSLSFFEVAPEAIGLVVDYV